MDLLPTYAYPFILAIVAAIAGWRLSGRPQDAPGDFPGWILYAVAIGCLALGLVSLWMSQNY